MNPANPGSRMEPQGEKAAPWFICFYWLAETWTVKKEIILFNTLCWQEVEHNYNRAIVITSGWGDMWRFVCLGSSAKCDQTGSLPAHMQRSRQDSKSKCEGKSASQ